MTIADDIASFLKRTPEIARLNFAFGKLQVSPNGYQNDVADAISAKKIKVKPGSPAVPDGAGAAYYAGFDTLDLRAGFSISKLSDQAYVVHECTHALFDLQNIGDHSGYDDEAASYIAEAIYLEALKKPPLDGHLVRVAAHGIAKKLLNGDHAVSAADMAKISDFVATTPLYEGKRLYESNGTDDRPFYKSMLR